MELTKHIITKTYKVPFLETYDFQTTQACIEEVLTSMPDYSLVSYNYDFDELAFFITVRKSCE